MNGNQQFKGSFNLIERQLQPFKTALLETPPAKAENIGIKNMGKVIQKYPFQNDYIMAILHPFEDI